MWIKNFSCKGRHFKIAGLLHATWHGIVAPQVIKKLIYIIWPFQGEVIF